MSNQTELRKLIYKSVKDTNLIKETGWYGIVSFDKAASFSLSCSNEGRSFTVNVENGNVTSITGISIIKAGDIHAAVIREKDSVRTLYINAEASTEIGVVAELKTSLDINSDINNSIIINTNISKDTSIEPTPADAKVINREYSTVVYGDNVIHYSSANSRLDMGTLTIHDENDATRDTTLQSNIITAEKIDTNIAKFVSATIGSSETATANSTTSNIGTANITKANIETTNITTETVGTSSVTGTATINNAVITNETTTTAAITTANVDQLNVSKIQFTGANSVFKIGDNNATDHFHNLYQVPKAFDKTEDDKEEDIGKFKVLFSPVGEVAANTTSYFNNTFYIDETGQLCAEKLKISKTADIAGQLFTLPDETKELEGKFIPVIYSEGVKIHDGEKSFFGIKDGTGFLNTNNAVVRSKLEIGESTKLNEKTTISTNSITTSSISSESLTNSDKVITESLQINSADVTVNKEKGKDYFNLVNVSASSKDSILPILFTPALGTNTKLEYIEDSNNIKKLAVNPSIGTLYVTRIEAASGLIGDQEFQGAGETKVYKGKFVPQIVKSDKTTVVTDDNSYFSIDSDNQGKLKTNKIEANYINVNGNIDVSGTLKASKLQVSTIDATSSTILDVKDQYIGLGQGGSKLDVGFYQYNGTAVKNSPILFVDSNGKWKTGKVTKDGDAFTTASVEHILTSESFNHSSHDGVLVDVAEKKITLSHPVVTTDIQTPSNSSVLSANGSLNIISSIEKDSYGHLSKVSTTTLTLPPDNNTTYSLSAAKANNPSIVLTANGSTASGSVQLNSGSKTIKVEAGEANKISITHQAPDGHSSSFTTENVSLGYGSTFTVVSEFAKDDHGHVKTQKKTTFTLPASDEVNTAHKHTHGTLITCNDTSSSISGTIKFSHNAITTSTSAASDVTLGHSGTFTVITGVTTDGYGHPNKITTTKFTLPADNNTTYSAGTGLSLTGTTFSTTFYNGETKANGKLYHGKSDPTSTTRMNYDGYFYATRSYGAVFNDYAEFRSVKEDIKSGLIAIEDPNNCDHIKICDTETPRSKMFVVSDTYGHAIGDSKNSVPVALMGRVLVYIREEDKDKVAIGDFIGSTSEGIGRIVSDEEAYRNPRAVLGTVSSIPNYETWGTDDVSVDGRIWINLK